MNFANRTFFERDDDDFGDRTINLGDGTTYNEAFSVQGDFVQGDVIDLSSSQSSWESPIDLSSDGDFIDVDTDD